MDHQRFKQVASDGTTLYLGAFGVMAELVAPGTSGARWNDYLSVGNVKVGVRFLDVAATTVTTRYYHTDHLGSIAVISNEAGTVVERLSFDAWGKRRYPNGADDAAGAIESLTTRGFTGHEQLDSVSLVHMNGRIYDPLVGRMMSADPVVPDALNPQAWNRYSYVGNDPLTFTDPSGHSWLSNFFKAVVRLVVTIVAAIIAAPIAAIVVATLGVSALTVGAGLAAAITSGVAGAIGSAIVTGLSGGNLGQILRASAIAGLTAFGFSIAGGVTNAVAGHSFNADHVTPKFGSEAHIFNIASHSAIGCVSAAASGGRCQDGALSAGVGSFATPLVGDIFPNARTDAGQRAGGALLTGAIGGLAAVAGGGKFENGAITAAFGYMYNETGSIGASVEIPGFVARGLATLARWAGYKNIEVPSSVGAGLVWQYPGSSDKSAPYDFGIYGSGSIPGFEVQKPSFNVSGTVDVGSGLGRIHGTFDGVSVNYNVMLGQVGGSVSFSNSGSYNGAVAKFGYGLGVSNSVTITGAYTVRDRFR